MSKNFRNRKRKHNKNAACKIHTVDYDSSLLYYHAVKPYLKYLRWSFKDCCRICIHPNAEGYKQLWNPHFR